jgi:hypothetical protein
MLQCNNAAIFFLLYSGKYRSIDMTLLQRCASLALEGVDRDSIAATLMLDRQMVDWIMDSDSFAVVLERASGVEREDS